jgi:phosphoserine phosphatase RsbU/P
MKNKGLAFKLSFLILTSSTLIFLAIFAYNYRFSRQIILENVEENAKKLSQATVNRLNMVLSTVEKVPKNLAYVIEHTSCDDRELRDILRSMIEKNPEIFGGTIAFEPYAYYQNSLCYAPYFYRSKEGIRFTFIPYEYFAWDWYQIPKLLDRPVWCEPYFDEGAGNIIMSTYSVPFYRKVEGERKMMGVVTADISLSWLQAIVASIKIEDTGYGFLISKNGTYVTHPNSRLVMNETIFNMAEERGDPHIREVGRSMIRGESGFVPFTSMHTGKKCWMIYEPLPSNGWSLGVLFPQDELMADITRFNRGFIIIGIAGFLFLLVVIVWISRSITNPLRTLAGASEEIATGNLDIEIPSIDSQDEVGKLAQSFENMKASLKEYIKELTEATAARERIESELEIAHDIQMGILHKVFPPFPDRSEFEIYATLVAAKEVGGDLYDFFFMDDDHLCITVGDVSGKGIPASLFMAITKTLIKMKATKGLTPEKVLDRVNEDLSMDNPSLMFVTLFLGILNIRTGEMAYSNGGHNPPYVIRSSGELERLEITHGVALGVVEEFSYKSGTVTLQEGDSIFLYTDGVTEAMNPEDELYTEERMIEELHRLKDKPIKELVDGIMESIREFAKGVDQSDDITMMRLKFYGAKP